MVADLLALFELIYEQDFDLLRIKIVASGIQSRPRFEQLRFCPRVALGAQRLGLVAYVGCECLRRLQAALTCPCARASFVCMCTRMCTRMRMCMYSASDDVRQRLHSPCASLTASGRQEVQ